jgi:hypothetical protein
MKNKGQIQFANNYFKLYRNLHKDCFSIQKYNPEKKGFRVFERAKSIILYNCNFKVNQNGRDKVLQEQRKNVHAFVLPSAYQTFEGEANVANLREVYYNPYKFKTFVYKDTEEPVGTIELLIAQNNKLYDATGVTL